MYNENMKYDKLVHAFDILLNDMLDIAKENNVPLKAMVIFLRIYNEKLQTQKDVVDYFVKLKRLETEKQVRKIKVSTTNAINLLEDSKIMKRVPSPEDKRVNILVISSKGEKIAKKIMEANYE